METNALAIAHGMGIYEPDAALLALFDMAAEAMRKHGGALRTLMPEDAPVVHRFTPGLYSRECTVRGPALLVSRLHLTEHQFVITMGECFSWSDEGGVECQVAGYHSITQPGTWRIVFVPVECRCVTFHATDLTDAEAVMAAITSPPPFLT